METYINQAVYRLANLENLNKQSTLRHMNLSHKEYPNEMRIKMYIAWPMASHTQWVNMYVLYNDIKIYIKYSRDNLQTGQDLTVM